MSNYDYKYLTPFKWFILENFPFIEADFDALTNWQLFCKLGKEMNKIIESVNLTGEQVENLTNAFNELKNYVDTYFENLDVQEEINNKLDALVQDGTLTRLIGNYIDPLIEAQNQEIENFTNSINSSFDDLTSSVNNNIDNINEKVNRVASGSPLVASSVAEMTDTSRVYVNTTDGKWYYYDGDSWEIGGTYQATEDSSTLSDLNNTFDFLSENDNGNLFNPLTAKNNTGITTADGTEVINNDSYVSDFIEINNNDNILCSHNLQKICFYNASKQFLYTNSALVYGQGTIVQNENAKYCKLMIMKSELSFNNRFNLTFAVSNNFDCDLNYKHINFNGIGNDTINLRKLDKSLKIGLALANLKLNINPLNYKDFSLGGIYTATGIFNYQSAFISTKDLIFIPAGTKIELGENYQMAIFRYTKDDVFINRYSGTQGFFNPFTILDDGYYRFIIAKNPIDEISINEIKPIIDTMKFTYNENNQNNFNYLPYSGEPININNKKLNYTKKSFTTWYQDSCQYNGKIFIFDNQGAFKVSDIETGETFTGFTLDQYDTIKPHCNCVCFSNQVYNENDPFPLLYVNAYNTEGLPKGTCYVHRINKNGNNYTTTLIQTISIGFTDNELWTVAGDLRNYGNFLVDTDNNHLIVYTLRNNKTRFFIFNLPDISSSNITLNIEDIIEYFDCDFFEYIQGGYYNNGKVYSLDGIGTQENPIAFLHVFDMNKKQLVSSLDLKSLMYEPESIFEYNNKLWIGQINFYEFENQ